MILITKTCDTCKHFYNDKHCVGCVWDIDKKENTKWELEDNSIVIERVVLDKIRSELMDTGAYEQETRGKTEFLKGIDYCLSVLDKYRIESEK